METPEGKWVHSRRPGLEVTVCRGGGGGEGLVFEHMVINGFNRSKVF